MRKNDNFFYGRLPRSLASVIKIRIEVFRQNFVATLATKKT